MFNKRLANDRYEGKFAGIRQSIEYDFQERNFSATIVNESEDEDTYKCEAKCSYIEDFNFYIQYSRISKKFTVTIVSDRFNYNETRTEDHFYEAMNSFSNDFDKRFGDIIHVNSILSHRSSGSLYEDNSRWEDECGSFF